MGRPGLADYPIAVHDPTFDSGHDGRPFQIFAIYPSVPHRADQLARGNRITYRDMPRMGMQDFVKKAIRIPDGYSPKAYHRAFSLAGHQRFDRPNLTVR